MPLRSKPLLRKEGSRWLPPPPRAPEGATCSCVRELLGGSKWGSWEGRLGEGGGCQAPPNKWVCDPGGLTHTPPLTKRIGWEVGECGWKMGEGGVFKLVEMCIGFAFSSARRDFVWGLFCRGKCLGGEPPPPGNPKAPTA